MKEDYYLNRKINKYFLLIFSSVYIMSNAVFVVFKTNSLRTGLLVGIGTLMYLLLIKNDRDMFVIRKNYLCLVLFVCVLLVMQVIISLMIFGKEGFERSILSIVLIVISALISPFFCNLVKKTDVFSIKKTINISFNLMTLLGLASVIFQYLNLVAGKSMFIFKEPSHFALTYLPLCLYKVYLHQEKKRLPVIMLILMIALLLENLTLLVGVIMIFMIVYMKHKLKLIMTVLIISILIFSMGIFEISYYIDRLKISLYSENLSVLVWVSGWERAFLNFTKSYGLGIGFQRMGIVGDTGIAMQQIYNILGGKYLNLYDGGSLAPKVISELGIFGVFLIYSYFKKFVTVLKAFINQRVKDEIDAFFISVYIVFSIQLLFRGVGYFAPGVFLFFSSVNWLQLTKNDTRNII